MLRMLDSLQPGAITLPKAIHRYFDVALYLLVLTGFGTLASTGSLDLPTVAIVSLVLFIRGYLLAKRRDAVIPAHWTTYLTLVYVAFYIADYFLISGSFIGATVHLVLFGMLVRLFSLQRDRDHYTLAILAFLMVLAAAVLTVDSIFLLSFAFFLLVAIATFMLMEMRHSITSLMVHAREGSGPNSYRKMGLSLAGIAPLVLGIVFLGGAAIFFVLPRISSRYLSAFATSNDLQTGFSDRVQLGSIGQIQQSSAVVMRIRVDGDTRGSYDLKWRGIGLSLFDGRTWSNPFEQTVALKTPTGRFVLGRTWPVGESQALARIIHYRVMMEPIGTNIFFVAPRVVNLEGGYRMIAMDAGGAIFNLDVDHPVTAYEAESNIAVPAASALRQLPAEVPSNLAMAYLQLPALDIRISKLAEQITAKEPTPYDKAAALERYLQTSFGYTLQLPRTVPRDPLSDFLFERKQGHCEYFASAMAVMLRTINIPSRVVNGFRTSEFNDLTGNYLVRASGAHSWVEAYFAGQGWVSFDPTPAAAKWENTTWNRFLLYVDAASSFWREWVVNYDATHQRALGHDATRSGRAIFDNAQEWASRHYARLLASARRTRNRISHSPAPWVLGGLLASAILLILARGRRVWDILTARGLRKHPSRAPKEAAALWYQHMTRLMARRGWKKSPFDTPGMFVQTIADRDVRDKVEVFTRAYEYARFGASAEDAGSLPKLFEQLEDVLMSGAGTGSAKNDT
jgi:transglutaminase-like putative cysteine protease